MEADNTVTEVLEVPGHLQKPHEIFIKEQDDWSCENSTQEENDPLCFEGNEHCGSTGGEETGGEETGGEEDSTPSLPVETDITIKEEPLELPDTDLPSPELTVKQEKDASDSPPSDAFSEPTVSCDEEGTPHSPPSDSFSVSAVPDVKEGTPDLPPTDSFSVSAVPHVKERHQSTMVAFDSTRKSPVSESTTEIGIVKTEPSPPHKGYASDSGPGSAARDVRRTAASIVQKADDDEVRVIAHNVLFCSAHKRERMPYSQMITMAIVDSQNWHISVCDIYRYTTRHFPSVKSQKNWKSSIRRALSITPIFVKTQRRGTRNAHLWSIVPLLTDSLRKRLSAPNRSCCKFQLVNQLHCDFTLMQLQKQQYRNFVRILPRSQLPPPCRQQPQFHLCEASVCHKTRKNSTSTQKVDNRSSLSSSGDSCRLSPPLDEDRRELESPNLLVSVVGSKTDSEDDLEHSPEVDPGPVPPLTPLIVKAIMLSPSRQVPLSAICSYCMGHSTYYKNKRQQCRAVIRVILASAACFRRVPQEGNRPDPCWTFATQYKDLLENNARKKSDHIDVAACHNPWEHDHGLYPKQSRSHPDEISEAGQDAGPVHSPESRVTVTGSDLCSDTDEAHSQSLWQRLQGSSQSCPADIRHAEGGARKRDRSTMDDSESERGCSRKRPGADGHHLEHLPRPDWLHSEHPYLDEPVDVNDMLDIKEEPFPEEELPMENIHTEENIEQRQNMCTTLLNTDCYGTVKIKQEKEEYPITVKYEMDHPFPDEPVDVNDMLDIKEEPFPEEELPMENIHTEENIEQRQNMCTTLLNTDCYGTVKIKQEKEEYPITVKYEMVDTWLVTETGVQ